jgi:hypothetical protein
MTGGMCVRQHARRHVRALARKPRVFTGALTIGDVRSLVLDPRPWAALRAIAAMTVRLVVALRLTQT